MNIADFISEIIKKQGPTKVWVANKAGINYKTFVDKLNRDSFTAKELLILGKVLNIDLNELKNQFAGGNEDD